MDPNALDVAATVVLLVANVSLVLLLRRERSRTSNLRFSLEAAFVALEAQRRVMLAQACELHGSPRVDAALENSDKRDN